MFKSTSAQGEHGGEVELGTSPSWRYVFFYPLETTTTRRVLCSRASITSSLLLARGFLFFFAVSFRGRPRRAKRAVGRSIEGWEDANALEIILFIDSSRFIAFYRVDARSEVVETGGGIFRSVRASASASQRAKDDEPGSSHRPRRRRRPERVYRTTNE